MSMLAGERQKQRAFLDAAADGDLDVVDAWLSSKRQGDVNVTLGEGWTALLYAVAYSRMGVVRRLLEEEDIDLNTTTITGSSALALALARKNNSLTSLLLCNGASRATISNKHWQELEAASWLWADVRLMLSPDWAVVWTPRLHRRLSPVEREKCRLLLYANVLALRHRERPASGGKTSSSSWLSIQSWTGWAMQQFWWMIGAFWGSFQADDELVRWRYLPQSLIYHIIEFAVFLW